MYKDGIFGKYRVFLVAMCANMMSFSIGNFFAWTSPVMPKLRDQTTDSPLNIGVTAAQEGWISSLTSIGSFTACFLIGSLTTSIGRKRSLLVCSLFIIISYVVLILATNIWFIYVARFLQGFGGGGGGAITPMYIGEIATDDTRGALGSLLTIFVLCGILYTYIIGPQVSYLTLQYCCLAIPILFFVTFLLMPESPYYFAINGQTEDVINSLKILRGKNAKDVEAERLKIQKEVDESMCNKSRIIDIIQNRVYRKAIYIVCGLLFFQQMSGTSAVTQHSQSIFISAGSTLDPAFATIILGAVQLVSNLLTPFFVERAGRKIILLISSIGMGIASIALGIFFYIQAFGDTANILWLPVTALVMFNVFFGFGFGPIPWAMLGEMFPSNIRPTATSIVGIFICATIFVVTRWFPELNAMGAYYAFGLFGVFCCLAFFFVYFAVVETKGLSLQEIQKKLQRSNI